MPEVLVRKGEPVDRALKRLKNKLDSEGIMDEVRRLRAFETPTQKAKRKAKANAKRGKVKFRFNINAVREAVASQGANGPTITAPGGSGEVIARRSESTKAGVAALLPFRKAGLTGFSVTRLLFLSCCSLSFFP